MAGRGPQVRGLGDVPDRIPDCLPEPVAHPAFPVVSTCHLRLWSGRGRPWCLYPEAPTTGWLRVWLSVRLEDTGIFNNVDPYSNQRMDLVVYDPGRPNQLYDVVVTNPVTAAVLRSNSTNHRVAWTQQRTKEKRYRVAATEAGMLFNRGLQSMEG